MIETANPDMSIGRQCGMVSSSRFSFQYQPEGETALTSGSCAKLMNNFLRHRSSGFGSL